MSRFALLALLNLPFVIIGLVHAIVLVRSNKISYWGFCFRLVFWGFIGFCLLFNRAIYEYLYSNNLTSSPPISLSGVILTTGIMLCFFLFIRTFARLETTERQLTDLQEKLAINLSKDKK